MGQGSERTQAEGNVDSSLSEHSTHSNNTITNCCNFFNTHFVSGLLKLLLVNPVIRIFLYSFTSENIEAFEVEWSS
jgi:hypothetical protein